LFKSDVLKGQHEMAVESILSPYFDRKSEEIRFNEKKKSTVSIVRKAA